MIRKICFLLLAILIFLPFDGNTRETYFGKNKVRYKDFEWSYIQTKRFDIHFYEDAYQTAKFTSTVLESSYVEICRELNYKIQKRIPVFIYNSHNDFQQTNIISSLISEGVGGFTEAFKNRIVVPFNGSYEDMRHVLHHELTHAVIYDMIYGNLFSSLLSKRRLFNLPLWYAEGFAEYSSRHGWDYFADMFVRDATVNNYLAPPEYLGGFLAYKEGQALVKFIADEYGEDKLGMILQKGKIHLTIGKAIQQSLGISMKKLWKDFSKEMKRRYWPEIAIRKEVEEIAKKLTKAREDGSYFNVKPEFSPEGESIAFFTDKSDYTEIVLMSAETGQITKRIIKSQRSADLESLHSFVSGLSFSPDGQAIVFVAKSKGKEALYFHKISKNKTYLKKIFDYYNIISPVWSPDGKKIAFSALSGTNRDIFVYDIEKDLVTQITDDQFDDLYPSWMPQSDRLIFSSDRYHPQNTNQYTNSSLYYVEGAYRPGGFEYGVYNLFEVNLSNNEIKHLKVGSGHNKYPRVSPDGKKVAFISNRNGIDNIYVAYTDTARYFALTDIISGVHSLSWGPDSDQLTFSAFSQGSFDIYILEELVPVGDNGMLSPTDFILGKYDLLKDAESIDSLDNDETNDSLKIEELVTSDSAAKSDTLLLAATDSDTGDSLTSTEAEDSVITETGIYDEGYVFVAEDKPQERDSLFIDIEDDPAGGTAVFLPMEEPAYFDSIAPPLENGEFKINEYKTKFTPDYAGGGFSYDTFFGLRGQTYFVFSDYLGNHQLYLATDLVNTIDQSNLQIFYFYKRMRTTIGGGFFHTKNFYLDFDQVFFSDRYYGFQLLASRPFSTFSRVELTISQSFIDRQYISYPSNYTGPFKADRNDKVTTFDFSYVTDNILWGLTGPVNGKRTKITFTKSVNLIGSNEIEFSAIEFDFRKYWHFNKSYSVALRFSGGHSSGRTPRLYYLGGTTNWIGTTSLDPKIYEVENLYFHTNVTPLRGVDFYGINGSRYGLFNFEFRYPMIDYFVMRFPLRLALSRVAGAIFYDMGAVWNGDNFKGAETVNGQTRLKDIKTGFGFGMRANLGFLVLRYDLAWSTDFYDVSDKPRHYFSLGADF